MFPLFVFYLLQQTILDRIKIMIASEVFVTLVNKHGSKYWITFFTAYIASNHSNGFFKTFLIGFSGCAIVLILSVVLAWRVKVYNAKYKQLSERELKMFNDGDPTSINSELGVDDQADLLPYNKSFEFERDKLKLGKQLGSGAFGRVVKAQARTNLI